MGRMQEKIFNENLTKRLENTCRFCDGNINKFSLILWRGVYPYEHTDSWQRFEEASLLKKKEFYSNLTVEDIIDADYTYMERIWGDFEIQN